MKLLTLILLLSVAFAQDSILHKPEPLPKFYSHRPVDRLQAVKFAFFGPVIGVFSLGYERMLNVKTGIDIQGGYVDYQDDDAINTPHATGGYIAVGVKYMLNGKPPAEDKDKHHTLTGPFIMPQLIYLNVTERYTNEINNIYSNFTHQKQDIEGNTSGVAVLLNIGVQHIIQNRLMIQSYLGFGYTFTSSRLVSASKVDIDPNSQYKAEYKEPDRLYAIQRTGNSRAAFRLAFNVGWMF